MRLLELFISQPVQFGVVVELELTRDRDSSFRRLSLTLIMEISICKHKRLAAEPIAVGQLLISTGRQPWGLHMR